MQIIKTPNGWLVEPCTSEEQKHLDWLVIAMKQAYEKAASTEDGSSASHLQTEAHTPCMVASG